MANLILNLRRGGKMTSSWGDGEYVEVYGNKVDVDAGYVGGRNVLLEKFDQVYTYVEEQQQSLEEYIVDFKELVAEFEMPNGWQNVLGNVVIADVAALDPSVRPSLGTIDLNNNWPTAMPVAPVLADSPNIDLGYTKPTKPDSVNPTINHTDDAFNSDLFADIVSSILDDIRNGGSGWGATVEQAIYDRARARNRIANEAEYEKGLDHISEIASMMPAGARNALQSRMQGILGEQATNINNDIIAVQAKLAWDATMSAEDRAVQVEKILRDFHDAKQNRSLEVEKANGDLVLKVFAELIKAFLAEWEGVIADLEAQAKAIGVTLQQNQLKNEKYKISWEGFKYQIEAVASENDSKAKSLEAESRAYVAESSAYEAWYRSLTEHQKAQLEKSRLELDKAKAEMQSTLEALIAINALKKEAISEMAGMANQAIASGTNATNASVGHSTSGTSTLSERYGFTASIGEDHKFDETAT
ncbi:MAG: hypothetical protein GY820_38905 [Gammaproteobacteria bacterium]|nr:hypothetical protein [Gammaproteobacteria bacterium]